MRAKEFIVETAEDANPARQAAKAIWNKKHHKKPKGVAEGEMNFEEGDCPVFAIALHRLSKLPLMALVEYDEQMGSAVLIHAYVKLNNKWRIDATGETDVDWMLQKYPNNGNAEEIEISEKDLIKLGYGKNKCPMLQQVLPHAKEVLQTIDNEQGVAEGSTGLSIQQLATISDEALDNAYHYGRSTPGNTFGWQANLKSAAYAKQMIDKGVTDIEAISDAIHKGWNTTAQAFVKNPDQFSDTEKLKAAGKLEAKLQQRAQLMKQNYAQLPEEEKEKDRVVARALLQAIKGEQGVAEGAENNGISFKVQKGKNKFATTLSVGVNPVGVYQYDADTGRSVAEVYPEFKGKGLGKLLVLHAIYTAAKLGLDFQEDESRTSEYDNVLDSLSSNGYIVDDDGYWYVTGEGEQYLQHSLKQGVAEGTDPDKKYTIKKSYTMSKAGVEKAVWYIMDGDFVVDVTDLRRDAKYYADKWNAAEKESSNASQNLHKPAVAESDLDRFKKYIRPVVKTTPKIEKTTNPAGRTTDHVEWIVTSDTGEKRRFDRKKQAQEFYDLCTKKDVAENFADGKNPQDRGDSARHGIPKHATIAQLEKIRSSKTASPRKKQLAHWQINMRRGKAK